MTTRVTQGNIKVVEDFLPTEQFFYSQKCAMFAENFARDVPGTAQLKLSF